MNITWTPVKLKKLKAAYAYAVVRQLDSFTLTLDEGAIPFYTGYAKYLIQHLTVALREH